MGFLARSVAERKGVDPLEVWAEIARAGRTSKAGPTVTLENAFRVATFFACVKVLSQGVAQVPFKLHREQQVNGLRNITAARDHRAYDLVSTAPNDWQTSFEFREQMVIHASLGNAYAWKNKTFRGLAELILLDPSRMVVEQPKEFERPVYKYTGKDGRQVVFPASDIWHVRGPSWSGFLGMDVLQIARDALGLTIAIDDSVSNLHKEGVRPTGVYSVEGPLTQKQHDDLVLWLKKQAADPGSALILDRGAKWLQQTMSSVDAQTKEMRSQQIEEVCRFMGVMPIMIGYSDKASTYASSEQMFLAHVIHTLMPWYTRIEQSADVNLLSRDERAEGYYFKFNAAGLLRGAMKDQGEFFARMLGAGGTRQVMTQDEIRELLELNPIGGEAAILHAPQGTQPAPAPQGQ
jgi:HK97 family phage portal protein